MVLWRQVYEQSGPLAVEAVRRLSEAYRKIGNLAAAHETIQVGLVARPNEFVLVREAAEVATSARNWQDAADLWERVRLQKGDKSAPSVFLRLTKALLELGRMDQAESTIRKALTIYPKKPPVVRMAAVVAAGCRNWEAATARWSHLDQLPDSQPTPKEYLARAAACDAAGNLDLAEVWVEHGLSVDAGDIGLKNKAAELVIKRRRTPAPSPAAAPSETPGVPGICAAFWEAEDMLQLLSWRIHGIGVWPLIRMRLYYAITQQLGLYDHPHPAFKGQVKTAEAETTESGPIYEPPADGETLPPRMVGLSSRCALLMATKKINGTEPYSDALRRELGETVILLDRPIGGPIMPNAYNFSQLQQMFRARYADPALRYIDVENRTICAQVEDSFQRLLGVDIGDVARICQNALVDYAAVKTGFVTFFRLNPISTLYLTNAYGVTTRATLSAARDCGARIVELQHGLISQYHLGYSWPGRPEVSDSPDEIWTFGKFWSDSTELAGGIQARVIGAPYVNSLAGDAGDDRDPRLVVFTSQGVIGRRLFGMALEAARRRPDMRIVFRLHPNEHLEDYESRWPEDAPANFSLSHGTPNIFSLLAAAGIQVGAFSTTLFEGMKLGTRTVVLNLPGIEYMAPVIRNGDALYAKDVDDLVATLDSAPLARDPNYYYAPPAHPLTEGCGSL